MRMYSIPPLTDRDIARFQKKYQESGEDCWQWTAATTALGYGVFRIADRIVYAHRVAYYLVHGDLEDQLVVDHLCHNPGCVNPEHLELVTQSLNVARQKRTTHCRNGHPKTEANQYVHWTLRKDGTIRRHLVCNLCKIEKRLARDLGSIEQARDLVRRYAM